MSEHTCAPGGWRIGNQPELSQVRLPIPAGDHRRPCHQHGEPPEDTQRKGRPGAGHQSASRGALLVIQLLGAGLQQPMS